MALKAKYQTSDFVFTGNPIILESEGYTSDPIKGGSFTVEYDGRHLYEGRFSSPLDIDISEIVNSWAQYYREPIGESGEPWELIERIVPEDIEQTRRLKVTVRYNENDDEVYEMIALPGGIPRQQFKAYLKKGKDVFDSRLYGPAANFFLTSRTSGWRIEMKETELYPLYFLSTGVSMRIKIMDPVSGKDLGYELPGGVYTLDIDMLRREMILETNSLVNVFDIYKEVDRAGIEFACRIVITPAKVAKERYGLKFRNSFGVFEIFDVTGKMEESISFPEGEESDYRRFDPTTRRFSNLRERLEGTGFMTVATPIEPGQRNMFKDLLASDETYLLGAFKEPVRVNVTADELKFQHRRETPESVSLKMTLTDPDTYFGDDISGPSDSQRPRVHTKQFTKQFN